MSHKVPATNAELMSRDVEPLPTTPAVKFQDAARLALGDHQLRHNMGVATQTIRAKRATVVQELPDWELLREAGRAIKDRTLRHLESYLLQREAAVTRAGGLVHWAHDAVEANQIIAGIVTGHGAKEVVKIKSLTTDEIGLNEALARAGVEAIETDLAELIIQLAGERSSHILVPAIHKNRSEIRELFRRRLENTEGLTDEPSALAAAARAHLRQKFLSAPVAISGANFGVAETGTICIVESEGNGRMCLTLRGARFGDGHREGRTGLAGHGGLPPALAAVEHRRADEPVHLVLDGRCPRRRTARVPSRAARQRPHQGACRSGRPSDPAMHPLFRLPEYLPRL